MISRRLLHGRLPRITAVWLVVASTTLAAQTGATLPSRLADRDFWELSQRISEPGGSFQSDNLVSNETGFQKVLPELVLRHPPGGVYMGVGPEQNFTYIAALRPAVAFIVDVRRENRDLHLMYKALFELAATRAEFVSLLFSRPRPEGLTKDSTAAELVAAFDEVPFDLGLQNQTVARIVSRLTDFHRLPLSEAELKSIRAIHSTFGNTGLSISYSTRATSLRLTPATSRVTYATLMRATDADDIPSSYLSSEARFVIVKDLHVRNLLIPVVGNFAGPKAIRSVGAWLKARGAIVSAFYLSNVEDYLRQGNLATLFCQNVASLPVDDESDFIRSGSRQPVIPVDPGAPPRPVSVRILSSFPSAPNAAPVTVTFSDGTRRDMTMEEASKIMPTMGGLSSNRLGSMKGEIRVCAGGIQQ